MMIDMPLKTPEEIRFFCRDMLESPMLHALEAGLAFSVGIESHAAPCDGDLIYMGNRYIVRFGNTDLGPQPKQATYKAQNDGPLRIDWQSGEKNMPVGFVVDLDTMKPLSGPDGYCCFVDEATGEWKRYVYRDGLAVIGADGRLQVESGKGRVKFFPFQGSRSDFLKFLRTQQGEKMTEKELRDKADALEAEAKQLRAKASELHNAELRAKGIADRLVYAAYNRCPCGAGLAYDPLGEDEGSVFNGPLSNYWDCSAILLGNAKKDVQHTGKLPFAFYEIKSEQQPSANGATTRPK